MLALPLMVGFLLPAPVPKDSGPTSPLAGRFGAEKEQRVKEFGGSEKTETAVKAGLKWLATEQKKDGTWNFDGTMSDETAAATGLAVMAFLGAGHTSKPGDNGEYAKNIRVGVAALGKMQKADGSFRNARTMYTHAIATTALCEAAALGDAQAKPAAQKALNYLLTAQGPNGSWGYQAKNNGDTSIVGWQAQAIRAAKAAGLQVEDKVLKRASKFLDTTANEEKGSFGYTNNRGTPTLTAVGLSSRIVFDGWTGESAGLERGAEFITKTLANKPGFDLYRLYYASLSLPLAGEDVWKAWNENTVKLLLSEQSQAGVDAGSWNRDTAYIGPSCGRLGSTTLAILTLENYYRYPHPLKEKAK